MKVIIAGTRTFDDYVFLCGECQRILHGKTITAILSGAAKGADQIGERYARRCGFPVVQFAPDWDRHGKAAGPMRNRRMAAEADEAIVFWDGKSRGAKNMINEMAILNKPCHVVYYGKAAHPTPTPATEVKW